MLFPDSILRIRDQNDLVLKYKYVCIGNDNELIVERNGCKISIGLNEIVGINNSDIKVEILISGNLIGLKVDSQVFFHTNHAIEKAVSRSLIKNKRSFVFLANNVLKSKNIRNKDDYKMAFSVAKHGESAVYYIDELRDCVMVVSKGLILTTYRYFGSVFHKES